MAGRTTKPGSGVKTLASRVVETPRANDPARAQALVADLLEQANKSTRAKLEMLAPPGSLPRALLEGIADNSPFLWNIAKSDPAAFAGLLESQPEQRLDELTTGAAEALRSSPDDEAAMRALRRMRSEAALLIALADTGGVWPLANVTHALTSVAEAAIGSAVDFLLRQAANAGKIRLNPERPREGSKFFALGMGKLGARELNYSSDIDLIVLYDRTAPLERNLDPAPFFVRLTRDLVKLLQDRTADGYVFRVDLRLRPDPGSTQAALSTDSALTYYEHTGQTWERAAMIKARVVGGDVAAGEAYLKEISPFMWRRYLDHAAIADVHDMKRQIHAFRGHDEIAVEGHNVKLGRGGIREIEFFVQTQQLIAGGRSPKLRGRETIPMLNTLAEEKWIGNEARDQLAAAYEFLRRVEHRLQMVADEQTHTLPDERDALERFARFFGAESRDAFAAMLTPHLRNVQRHYASLFEDAPPRATIEGKFDFEPQGGDRETLDTLRRLGFQEALAAHTIAREWLSGSHRSLKGDAVKTDLQAVLPALLVALARTGNADAAILAADRFFSALPGAQRLLGALRTHPDLVQLLATILGTAPRLGSIVAHSPSVLDGLLDPAFFGMLPDEALLSARLDAVLKQAQSEEEFLDLARRFGREQQVLIGVRVVSGTIAANRAGEAYARLASVLIRAIHASVAERFAATHGRLKNSESAVVALGKLGGNEMTAGSDLDLILLYDFDREHPESGGPRPLPASQYFARLTQRLVSALTIPTNLGKLYEVDMRLRPSGRSGPLATSLESFANYQRDEAWTWEHMALTRARVVSSTPAFSKRVEAEIRKVLRRGRDADMVAGDVAEMRRAIADEKGEGERWDLKFAAGGLIDIEFIAQYLQLVHAEEKPEILSPSTGRVLEAAQALNILKQESAETLRAAFTLHHDLTQILRVCLPAKFDPAKATPSLHALMARAAGLPDFPTLEAHLVETQAKVRRYFREIVERA
jgi:glutamate-ammonia-ligase adenylyltransferase